MPFVSCDEETFDDKIFIYRQAEDAKKKAAQLLECKNPVQIAKLENKLLLGFYSILYTIGVNCIDADLGKDQKIRIQLPELVEKKKKEDLPEGAVVVENPQFHLTAIYLMQKMRSGESTQEEITELQEEMLVHFKEGRYLAPVQEGKGIPMLKHKEGGAYHPLFTDRAEFSKFNRENAFQPVVVEFPAISKMLSPDAQGVVINPLGINVQLQISSSQA